MTISLKEYFAKNGSHYSNKDANIIGPELDRLTTENGFITPEMTVESARPTTSPIHPYFEWNDNIAAESFRNIQANRMLRSIEIKVVDGRGKEQDIRAFHSVILDNEISADKGGKKAYVSYRTLKREPEKAQQVIESALREARAWKAKYEIYVDVFSGFQETFQPLFDAIGNIDEAQQPLSA